MNKSTKEVFRFVVTGGSCFLIELVSLILLKELFHLDTLIATPIAFTISVVVNYFLCVAWVFPGTGDGGAATKVAFVVTSLIGLALNEVFMLLFRILWGETYQLLNVGGFDVTMYMLNKAVATLLVMIWNFLSKKAVLKSNLLKIALRKGWKHKSPYNKANRIAS